MIVRRRLCRLSFPFVGEIVRLETCFVGGFLRDCNGSPKSKSKHAGGTGVSRSRDGEGAGAGVPEY